MTTNAERPSEHVLTLRWFPALGERRPDCSCGWVGSYVKNAATAQAEWERHATDASAGSPTPEGT